MAVRIQHTGKRTATLAQRAIQIAGQVKAGIRLKIDLLDAVTIADNFPENCE